MSEASDKQALRIFRKIDVRFKSGRQQAGSGFVAVELGLVIASEHVFRDLEQPTAELESVHVTDGAGVKREARIRGRNQNVDLAVLETDDDEPPGQLSEAPPPAVGQALVSAVGQDLLSGFSCDLIQISGMINNDNSGGPLFVAGDTKVTAVVTAKYVPLLQEIERLRSDLSNVPQMPGQGVAIMGVNLGAFFNATVGALHQTVSVLRLVQVGTGWAVPVGQLGEANLL